MLRPHLLKTLPILLLFAISSAVVNAQIDEERRRAFQLYKDAKYVEALPLFEKLAVAYPEDRDVIENLGLLVITQTAYLKDPVERKAARKRGRELLLRAQKLGAEDPLLSAMIANVPPDGGDDVSYSSKKEVDDAMREGEGAFAKGEFPKALEAYQRALLLDPTLYSAALFTGDVYYKTAEQRKAGEWFARAVEIDPNRETAYRYWGDSLMKQGRITEAGDKFVEAYIAEPYNRMTAAAFSNWGQRVNIKLAHPRVEFPANVSRKTYRHSLKEETHAMRAALRTLDKQTGDASLQVLKKLDKEGLLEAFILLALADEGIAQDFPAYRKTNVDNLRRYVKEYVLTGGGQ